MKFFCITRKSNPVLHSGEQEWLERRHVFYMTCKSNPFSTHVSKDGWRDDMSSTLPPRAIQSSTQVSKDCWRDDMEFFCISCKSNKVLYSVEQGGLER
jgi:hypothetical protein